MSPHISRPTLTKLPRLMVAVARDPTTGTFLNKRRMEIWIVSPSSPWTAWRMFEREEGAASKRLFDLGKSSEASICKSV